MSESATAAFSPPGSARRTRGRRAPRTIDWVAATGALYVFATPLDIVPTPFATPSTITGLIFIGVWMLSILAGHPRVPKRSLPLLTIGALVVWYLLTTTWTWDTSLTLVQIQTFVLLALSAVAVGGAFGDRFVAPTWALSLGGAVAGVAALLGGRALIETDGVLVQAQQSTFLGIDQNALAFNLCLGLAASAYLLVTRIPVRARLAALIPLVIITAAILAVGSRTGVGSLLVTLTFMVIASARSVRSAIASLLALGVVVWAYVFVSNKGYLPDRVVRWLEQPSINDSRLDIIQQYWYAREDWQFGGVGPGADASYLFQTQGLFANAHSAFWKVWIETGAVGLFLWALLVVSLAVRGMRSQQRLFFILMAPTILAFFYTLGGLNSNMLWVVFGLAIGLPAQLNKTRRQTSAATSHGPSSAVRQRRPDTPRVR